MVYNKIKNGHFLVLQEELILNKTEFLFIICFSDEIILRKVGLIWENLMKFLTM